MQTCELLGATLAKRGCMVVTGGYAGVMYAVSRGAVIAGGQTIGYLLTGQETQNAFLTLRITCDYYGRRNRLMQSDAFVVVGNGGIGTWCELMELLHHNAKPGIFWKEPRRVAIVARKGRYDQSSWEEDVLLGLHERGLMKDPPGSDHPWLRIVGTPYEAAEWVAPH